MTKGYLDYAFSSMWRALPSVKDGLKPLHRRILWTLKDYERFVKSARIVGDVLGKYHPHGDQAAYEGMQTLAIPFRRNAQLVEPQGNWGSLDGDPAAGMRYTEAKISAMAVDLFYGPEAEFLDLQPNYDETEEEPKYFSPKIPILLVNGAWGATSGYQCCIPPHNLGEVCDATMAYVEGKKPHLVNRCITGPDFKTGGMCVSNEGSVERGILNGKGSMLLVPFTEIEEYGRGRWALVLKNVPYASNKELYLKNLLKKIVDDPVLGDLVAEIQDQSGSVEIQKADKTTELIDDVRVLVIFKKTVSKSDIDGYRDIMLQKKMISATYNYSSIVMYEDMPVRCGIYEIIKGWYDYRYERINYYLHSIIDRYEKDLVLYTEVLKFVKEFTKLSKFILEHDTKEIIAEFSKYDISTETTKFILKAAIGRFKNRADDIVKLQLELKQKLNSAEISLKNINGLIYDEVKTIKRRYATPRRTTMMHVVGWDKILKEEPVVVVDTKKRKTKEVKKYCILQKY